MDSGIISRRVNSCALKHLFCSEFSNQKNRPKTLEILSPTRYYSHVFKILRLAPQKKNCGFYDSHSFNRLNTESIRGQRLVILRKKFFNAGQTPVRVVYTFARAMLLKTPVSCMPHPKQQMHIHLRMQAYADGAGTTLLWNLMWLLQSIQDSWRFHSVRRRINDIELNYDAALAELLYLGIWHFCGLVLNLKVPPTEWIVVWWCYGMLRRWLYSHNDTWAGVKINKGKTYVTDSDYKRKCQFDLKILQFENGRP